MFRMTTVPREKLLPSQQEVQWSQLKVGVLVLVGLAVLVLLIFLMSGSTGGLFTGKLTVRSYFENSAGLKVGAPVNLEGVTIGNVKSIKIAPDRKLTPVEITMKPQRESMPTPCIPIRKRAWKPSACSAIRCSRSAALRPKVRHSRTATSCQPQRRPT